MFEYIGEIFTKPELQRSFADDLWLTIVFIVLIIIGIAILCFAWWLFFELPDNIRKWRKKKNEKDNIKNN